ncbi:MAG: Uma2 family endonuclease [Nostocales cyanobacterium 94392]|nr:Uma2 family endonuclease [Nostocales cyanobacterium 94392]
MTQLTLEEFLALPQKDITYELIDGEAKPKPIPKYFHSRLKGVFCLFLNEWSKNRGEVGIKWDVILKRKNIDWVPVPDLLYISYSLLPQNIADEPCPVAPELVIEIISPGQTFGEMTQKATDYIKAGVLRVWVVDTKAKTITIFAPASVPVTYRDNQMISDNLLPGLKITPKEVFQRAGLIG